MVTSWYCICCAFCAGVALGVLTGVNRLGLGAGSAIVDIQDEGQLKIGYSGGLEASNMYQTPVDVGLIGTRTLRSWWKRGRRIRLNKLRTAEHLYTHKSTDPLIVLRTQFVDRAVVE